MLKLRGRARQATRRARPYVCLHSSTRAGLLDVDESSHLGNAVAAEVDEYLRRYSNSCQTARARTGYKRYWDRAISHASAIDDVDTESVGRNCVEAIAHGRQSKALR